MVREISIPKGWILNYDKLPKENFSRKVVNKRLDLFETCSPGGITLRAYWDPSLGSDGYFVLVTSKDDDLDVYLGVNEAYHVSAVRGDIISHLTYLSSPDWRWYLETVAERKYTIVGDKVFYRDEKDAKVLVCMDKASRKEVFRKNLVNAKIARIEKHPENKGLFILFDSKEFTQADYERMKRTNFGLFDLNGNLIWWAEPLITPLVGGEIGRNHIFFKQGAWLPLNAPADKKYDPAVYSMKYSAWCRFDPDTGKLKEFGEHR